MQLLTKAIVLTSLKYGDTSLIVKCYTEQLGIQSYMLKGVLKRNKGKLKSAYFQPLTQLELIANHSKKSNLQTLKDANLYFAYESIHTDFTKQSIAFFLAEMLANAIQEEEANPPLFTYIETSLRWLDIQDKIANFPIVFLMHLTKFLGFFPKDTSQSAIYFNLADGIFTDSFFVGDYLHGEDLRLFKQILGIKFDTLNEMVLGVQSRHRLLEILFKYYSLHLLGFKTPKSIAILKNLFD
ncbi:MAG: DNA repair protein RecO [Flavicella sp.]